MLQVRRSYKGLVCWSEGGFLGDLAAALINTAGNFNLKERERNHIIAAKHAQKLALQKYLTFVHEQQERDSGAIVTPVNGKITQFLVQLP
jgi:hypothetical protein